MLSNYSEILFYLPTTCTPSIAGLYTELEKSLLYTASDLFLAFCGSGPQRLKQVSLVSEKAY